MALMERGEPLLQGWTNPARETHPSGTRTVVVLRSSQAKKKGLAFCLSVANNAYHNDYVIERRIAEVRLVNAVGLTGAELNIRQHAVVIQPEQTMITKRSVGEQKQAAYDSKNFPL
jgi:hypothetical protein